jgi:tetratricopeptide (TPR) repeat protein
MVVYAHGYKNKSFTFNETSNFERPGYEEFKSIDQVVKIRSREIKNAVEYWENIKDLDVKDPFFDLEDYKYFIEKYPNNKNTPRAQYYIGYTYEEEIKDHKKAIVEYEKVLRNYPGTDSAKSAEERLMLLKKKQK